MRSTLLPMLCAALCAACTATRTPPADSAHADSSHGSAVSSNSPLDSTVQRKLPPDTLMRGDGARCLVRPTMKFDAVDIGAPYPCQWSR